MLKVGTSLRYGLRTLLFLGKQKGFSSTREIAEEEKISRQYLEKIILKLKKGKAIVTKRGKAGGIKLAKPLHKFTVKELAEMLEEKNLKLPCEIYPCQRQEKCEAQRVWLRLQKELDKTLEKIRLTKI